MDVVEIARAMYEAPAPDETEGAVWPPGHPEDVAWWMSRATAVMPMVRRAQAEAEVRALRDAADEIKATFDDYDRRRPLHPKAKVPTDYVNDPQWAELIVRNRADRIEQEVEHD